MNKSNLAYEAPDPQGQVVQFPKKERQFMSYKDEGYTKTPNYLVDENYVAQMTGNALKCYVVINRFTEGFSRKEWAIASTFLLEKTGIKKPHTAYDALKQLEGMSLLRVHREDGKTNKFTITNPCQKTAVVPKNGSSVEIITSAENGHNCSAEKRHSTSAENGHTKKESFKKENIKEREEEEAHGENQKFTAQKRQLSFVEYHVSDRTPISLKELFKKYPAQVDFIDQAKISFPNHTVDQIFSELQKMGQWSLSSSNHMPQKWMSIWLGFMQKVPTAAEQAAAQMRKAKSKPTQKTEKKYHQYGQVPVTPSIQDVGGNHE